MRIFILFKSFLSLYYIIFILQLKLCLCVDVFYLYCNQFSHIQELKKKTLLFISLNCSGLGLGFLFRVQQGQNQGFTRDWTFSVASSGESTSRTVQIVDSIHLLLPVDTCPLHGDTLSIVSPTLVGLQFYLWSFTVYSIEKLTSDYPLSTPLFFNPS